MSQELRKDLSKYVVGIAKDTAAVLGDARVMVEGFAKERVEMSNDWKSMVNSLAKSAGVEPRVKAAKAVAVEPEETPVKMTGKKKGRKKKGKKNR